MKTVMIVLFLKTISAYYLNVKKIIQISKEVYLHMGGLNFDEKDFQLALDMN